LLNDKATTLEHDDFGASLQMSHQNDEKKEEVSKTWVKQDTLYILVIFECPRIFGFMW